MKIISQIGMDIVWMRSSEQTERDKRTRIEQHQETLDILMLNAATHLRDLNACTQVRDQLEHWHLALHRSYTTSEIYRPYLTRSCARGCDADSQCRRCSDSLAGTVEAFLGLQSVIPSTYQSWATLQRAVSAGLLLGIMKQYVKISRVDVLLGRLIGLISDLVADPQALSVDEPIKRSLSALTCLVASDGTNTRENCQFTHSYSNPDIGCTASLPTSTLPSSKEHIEVSNISPYSLLAEILWGSNSYQYS